MNLTNRSNLPSVTYNGTSFYSMGLTLQDIDVGSPTLTPVTSNIAKRIGNLFYGNEIGERTIEMTVAFIHKNKREFQRLRKEFENLIVQQDTGQKELILDDDTEWSYFGVFTAIGKWENYNEDVWYTTLTFTCYDPLAYGQLKTIKVGSGVYNFTPEGYNVVRPIFHGVATKNSTWAGIATAHDYLYLGGKIDIETGEIPTGGSAGDGPIYDETDPEAISPTDVWNPNKLLKDTAQNLSLWQRVSNDSIQWELDKAHIGKGSYVQQADDDINLKTFGTRQNTKDTWYGAGIERMLTKNVSNWRVRWRIQSMNRYKRAENKLELYLLDQNKRRIGKLSIKDNSSGSEQTAVVQVFKNNGATKTITELTPTVKNKTTSKTAKKVQQTVTDKKGKTTTSWVTLKEGYTQSNATNELTDFYGYIELEHYNGVYTARIVKLDTKTRNEIGSWEATWTDKLNELSRDLAGFGMFFGKADIDEDKKGIDYKPNYLAFCDLEVWETVHTVGGNLNANQVAAYNEGDESTSTTTTETVVISSSPQTIFTAGDEIQINCEMAQVYKNGMRFNEAFSIGSEFLEFKGGETTEITFSDQLEWYITYRPTSM